jgi:acyl-coenzyme A synthetase/AMP-(fatty) acid ligase
MLKPGSLPTLRWSLFSGEPITAPAAQKWQAAAPNSILENLYGPTEATINITLYRWEPQRSPAESHLDIVPIGWMFPGHEGQVVDAQDRPVPDGQDGELLLRGPQVTTGYLDNPEKTAQQYVRLPGDQGGPWYRTGDLVRRRPDGCILYLGRLDHQVQIHGHRVELLEVEQVMRQGSGAELVAAIPWPQGPSTEAVFGFVSGADQPGLEEKVLCACREKLPGYMVPRRVYAMASLPLNPNGKIDRKALAANLEDLLRDH